MLIGDNVDLCDYDIAVLLLIGCLATTVNFIKCCDLHFIQSMRWYLPNFADADIFVAVLGGV